jgi:hypothetical protein
MATTSIAINDGEHCMPAWLFEYQLEKEIEMPQEKNILVNRGIPRTPSLSNNGFGSNTLQDEREYQRLLKEMSQ